MCDLGREDRLLTTRGSIWMYPIELSQMKNELIFKKIMYLCTEIRILNVYDGGYREALLKNKVQ
jgi:hypothetical protein